MRKFSLFATALAATLCLSSCEPEVFNMYVEMRNPSVSGLDLAGKAMSVVYLDDLSGKDTVFNARLAEGFAKALEKDYFAGEESVAIYRMEKDMAGDYASRDTLVNALMQTGDDVIFLFDSPTFGDLNFSARQPVSNTVTNVQSGSSTKGAPTQYVRVSAPFKLNLYAYDSMGVDTVKVFKGTSNISQTVFCNESNTEEDLKEVFYNDLAAAGETTGTKSSVKFVSTWEAEPFFFYYFGTEKWIDAAQAAYEYKWHDAIEIWLKLLDTNSVIKRAAAEYNIATGFYLLGDYTLAERWLDQSDKDDKMTLSSDLRKRIQKRKK